MSVFGRNADNVLRDLSHAGAWGQCVTVHSDNKQKQVCATTAHEKMWCAVGVLSTQNIWLLGFPEQPGVGPSSRAALRFLHSTLNAK